jgi:hypothetical protein
MPLYSHSCSIFELSIVIKGNSTPILSSSPLIGETFNGMEEDDSSKLPPNKAFKGKRHDHKFTCRLKMGAQEMSFLPLPLSDPLSCLAINSHHACNSKTQGNKVSNK